MDVTGGHGADVVFDASAARAPRRSGPAHRPGRPLPAGRLQRRPAVGAHRPPAAQGVDGQLLGRRRDPRLPGRSDRVPPLRVEPVPARLGQRGARRAARARGGRRIRPVHRPAHRHGRRRPPRSRTTSRAAPAAARSSTCRCGDGGPRADPTDLMTAASAASRARRLRPGRPSATGWSATARPRRRGAASASSGPSPCTARSPSSLVNRLKVVDWVKAHPEVAGEPDRGTARGDRHVPGRHHVPVATCSTRTPRNRPLLRWEAGDSVPPPTPAEHRRARGSRPRRPAVDMLARSTPASRRSTTRRPTAPTECISVMGQASRASRGRRSPTCRRTASGCSPSDSGRPTSTTGWCSRCCRATACAGRWTLKSPGHALALDALTAVYPDARLVLLHRDPVVLSASVCSLIHTVSAFSEVDHRDYIARPLDRHARGLHRRGRRLRGAAAPRAVRRPRQRPGRHGGRALRRPWTRRDAGAFDAMERSGGRAAAGLPRASTATTWRPTAWSRTSCASGSPATSTATTSPGRWVPAGHDQHAHRPRPSRLR